ncbi:MAG: putative sensor protein, partial [Frankiales bacterium]|nr:putative sensor protein [Frankiales bacterium]
LDVALQRVERFAAQTPAARAATAVVAVVDPIAGTLTYATCGHPPPLVVTSDGTARYLPLSGGGPLGLGAAAPLAHDVLGAGDVLVLYSDGLIERTGRTLDEGLADLARTTGDVVAGRVLPLGQDVSPTERACRFTTELMLRQASQVDDVTVLTAGARARDPRPLGVTLPARPESLATLRAAADAWLACLGLRGPDQAEFMLVVTEAATNAIEHAYPPGQPAATFDVEARLLRDGMAAIRVSDHGSWEADPAVEAGRGLMIMKELTADLNVVRRPTGTTVELWQRLVRPVVRGSTGQLRTTRGPRVAGLEIARFDVPPGARTGVVLRCRGTLDCTTSAELDAALERTGAGPVVVDLTELDLLSSAGVRVLAAQAADLVSLVAAPGSPARAVLDLVQMPASDQV